MHVAIMVLGLVMLAVGAQGAIRLVLDTTDAGLLAWLPGGMAIQLVAYVLIAIIGIVLAGYRSDRARKAGKVD